MRMCKKSESHFFYFNYSIQVYSPVLRIEKATIYSDQLLRVISGLRKINQIFNAMKELGWLTIY